MAEAKFHLFSDSCCDLPREAAEAADIGIISLYVAFNDGVYKRDYYDFGYEEFYRKMLDEPGNYPRTSLPSEQDYMDAWEPYVKEGIPVLSISMTSKMSGSYNSARMAREEMLERYPDAVIEVVDSLALTILQGMIVLEAVALRDRGVSAEQAAEQLRAMHKLGRAYFTIWDLSYLIKGGRIGSLIKQAAIRLPIKPVILFRDGNILPCRIARNRHKALKELAHQAACYFIDNGFDPADYHLTVGYGLHEADGLEVLEALEAELKEAGCEAKPGIIRIGTMVGAHNGPYLVGVAMLKKSEAGVSDLL